MLNGFNILIRTSSINENDTIHESFQYYREYLSNKYEDSYLKVNKIDKIEVDTNEAYIIDYIYNGFGGKRYYSKCVFVYSRYTDKKFQISLQYNKKYDEPSREFIDTCFFNILSSVKFLNTNRFKPERFINDQYTPPDYSIKKEIKNEFQGIKFQVPQVMGENGGRDIRIYDNNCILEIKSNNLKEKELFRTRVNSFKYLYEKYYWNFTNKVIDKIDMLGVSAEHIGYYGGKKEYHIYLFKKNQKNYWITLEFTLNNSIEGTRNIVKEIFESIEFF